MLHKRRKSKHRLPAVEVSVVSLMDILTTLLFFLLMFAAVTKFSIMPATALPSGTLATEDKKQVFTLEITINSPTRATLWLGPISELKKVGTDTLLEYLGQHFKGNQTVGFTQTLQSENLSVLVRNIQKNLIAIKRGFPHESKAVLALSDRVSYQSMIDLLAGVRSVEGKQAAFTITNLLGQQERSTVLFPEVILAETDSSETEGG